MSPLPIAAQERMCHSKRVYLSAGAAAIVAGRRMARKRGLVLRIYPCPNCSFFHLTKQPLKGTSRPSGNARSPLMTATQGAANVNARSNATEITAIDAAARQYADAQTDLDSLTNDIRVKIDQVVREYWPELRRSTTRAAERYEALFTLVSESRPAFDKPKTRILHGVRCGYRKALDSIQVLDADNTCTLIEKHLPERQDVLIATTRKPIIAGLQQLDDDQLKKIGCKRVPGGDEAFAALADTQIDKVVQALMKSAIEKAEASS